MLVLNCKKVEKESEFIMKRLNQKGFTLIELLAVITIMAILMIVAVPAVARTIDNSKKDTYCNIAGTYISAVRNAFIAEEMTCTGEGNVYYYAINSAGDNGTLLQTGGKSPWGNEVKGYVKWENASGKVTYSILIVDSAGNGIVGTSNAPVAEDALSGNAKRSYVYVGDSPVSYPTGNDNVTAPSGARACTIS